MVEQKPEEASSFLRDNIVIPIFSLFILISCESSFNNFDEDLNNRQIELQDFNTKSNDRKKIILEND